MKTTGRRSTRRSLRGKTTQLALWGGAGGGRSDLLATSVLLRHKSCPRVLEMIRQVRLFFPELDGVTIRVGLTRTAAGLASREQPWIWVNPRKLTRHTIAHEFVHLLQNRGEVPGGEKSADLHALARHPFLVDDLPYYLKLPRSLRLAQAGARDAVFTLLSEVSREALRQKEGGLRNYLRWFENELERRWSERGRVSALPVLAGSVAAVMRSLFDMQPAPIGAIPARSSFLPPAVSAGAARSRSFASTHPGGISVSSSFAPPPARERRRRRNPPKAASAPVQIELF